LGASDHCFADKSLFTTYKALEQPLVGLSANKGATFSIIGKGNIEIITDINGMRRKVKFENALHTPEMRSNLISLSRLEDKGARFEIGGGKVLVKSPEGEDIMTGTRFGWLYAVSVHNPNATAFAAHSKRKAVNFDTWHQCLVHANADTIRTMFSKGLVDGLNIQGNLEIGGLCEDCIFGKHTAHPYNDNGIRERDLLERIHIDIWGPAPVQSAGGASYFMLIMDGYSSYRQVTFLSSKSAEATLKVFRNYHVEAERHTGRKLQNVRLDMGKEWLNSAWEMYAKAHGIKLDFTTPYAHQQNGAAERSMRLLLDGARSVLAESDLPIKYWADAVNTVTYVRNFIPSMRRPGSIPAELWYGRRQDISHLRPFGTTAYAHIPLDLGLSKLSPRSTRVTLIGYFGHGSYKLLNRTTRAVFRSRDVIFEEGMTHLAKQPTPTVFSEEDNPFPLKPDQTSKNMTESLSKHVESQPLRLGIASRPTIMQDLL